MEKIPQADSLGSLKKETISEYKLDDIKNEEIRALYEPINNLINQLKSKIENCEYDLIIGEDASGRIPALIFDRILKNVYQKKGKENPKLLFMAGVRWFDENEQNILDKFENHIEKNTPLGTTKALVVTEYILYGHSILPILKSLKSKNIKYDIASAVVTEPNSKNQFKKEISDHLYFGLANDEHDKDGFLRYGKPLNKFIFGRTTEISGVAKNRGDLLSRHANQYVSNDSGSVKENFDQKKINEARKDTETLADILFKENFKLENS